LQAVVTRVKPAQAPERPNVDADGAEPGKMSRSGRTRRWEGRRVHSDNRSTIGPRGVVSTACQGSSLRQ